MATEELLLGNQYSFLRHMIQLESIGIATVLVGRGVCIGVGIADRGPAMEPHFISGAQPSLIKKTYFAGPLMDGMQTAAAQGVSVIGGVRVLGEGYATASLDLFDWETEPNQVATLNAIGPGTWGGIPRVQIDYGDLDGRVTEIFNGNGGEIPYSLLFDDLVEYAQAYVKVEGTEREIVYTGTPDPGETKLDKTLGKLSFATGEWPTGAEKIEVRYRYHSRKITVQDETGLPVVYNNLMDLTTIQAQMRDSPIATFDPVVGATHLPARTLDQNENLIWVTMTGGLDGDEPTIDDWELAFNNLYEQLPPQIIPSSIFITQNSATAGATIATTGGDIIALLDTFLKRMANGKGPAGKMPCQGFASLVDVGQVIPTDQEMADFVEGYDNLFLTQGANYLSDDERNLAAARAGQEAALGLGISPAVSPLVGVDGLLFQINDVDKNVFTYGQVDVLIKETGVHPYVGISTDPEDNFKRTVDVRTICNVIILIDQTVQHFLNQRRTLTNLSRMQNSIDLMLKELEDASVLDDHTIKVTPNAYDRNAVDIACKIQPVGHIERVYTWLGVGYWSTKVAA